MPRLNRSRSGYSLIEVLVVIAILGIVGGAIMTLLTRQQRFYRDVNETVNVRRELRTGASILPLEARSISTIGGDVEEMKPTEFEFRATIGSAVVCERTQNEFFLPPLELVKHTLTSWYSVPRPGDIVFAFDDGDDAGDEGDVWERYTVRAVSTTTSTCAGSPFLKDVGGTQSDKPRWRLEVADGPIPIPSTIGAGAVLRIVRPVRYSLYESGTGKWYLGYQEQKGGSWSDVEPVSGPYLPGESGGKGGGVEFAYYDGANVPTTDPVALARVAIVLRGASGQTGMSDSLLFSMGIRNFQ